MGALLSWLPGPFGQDRTLRVRQGQLLAAARIGWLGEAETVLGSSADGGFGRLSADTLVSGFELPALTEPARTPSSLERRGGVLLTEPRLKVCYEKCKNAPDVVALLCSIKHLVIYANPASAKGSLLCQSSKAPRSVGRYYTKRNAPRYGERRPRDAISGGVTQYYHIWQSCQMQDVVPGNMRYQNGWNPVTISVSLQVAVKSIL